jgi:hypothetical protein
LAKDGAFEWDAHNYSLEVINWDTLIWERGDKEAARF